MSALKFDLHPQAKAELKALAGSADPEERRAAAQLLALGVFRRDVA
ncbi:hypothetical protein [Niveibacterium terrae]